MTEDPRGCSVIILFDLAVHRVVLHVNTDEEGLFSNSFSMTEGPRRRRPRPSAAPPPATSCPPPPAPRSDEG
jgi:hypothetical protein